MFSKDFLTKSVLVFGMLITGSVNTISKKYQNQAVVGSNGATFDHPWTQTAFMDSGELLCLLFLACAAVASRASEKSRQSRETRFDEQRTAFLTHEDPAVVLNGIFLLFFFKKN